MNNNYYQSDIKTSRQEDSIYAMKYASQQMLIDKLKKQLEAYENMRKEALEILNQYMPNYASCVKAFDELESILNKVGEDNEK